VRALGPLQAIYLPGHWILTNLSFTLPHTSQSTPCQHNRSAFYGSPEVQSEKSPQFKCHPILNFTFSRHASQKFFGRQDNEGNPDSWGKRELWEVIGKYDMLRVETHVDLNHIINPPDKHAVANAGAPYVSASSSPSDNSLVANTGVVLVCFKDFREKVVADADNKERYEEFLANIRMDGCLSRDLEQSGNLSEQSPFLFVAQFAISAAAHECMQNYDGVLDLMQRIRDKLVAGYRVYCTDLKKHFSKPNFPANQYEPLPPEDLFFFRSLGAFDIAVVALPRTPTQLCGLIHFANEARKLLLKDVCDPDPKNGDIPGHAFALVEDIVAYRTTPESHGEHSIERSPNSVEEIAEQWAAWGLELQTTVMVDSGHEEDVEGKIPRLKQEKNNENMPLRLSGLHTMRIDYRDVHEFAAEWTPLLSDRNFHVATLVDSTSSLAIRPPFTSTAFKNAKNSTDPAWKLSTAFREELTRIRKAIQKWQNCVKILHQQQKKELELLLDTFENSFYRLETATALRDLLPFMRQLAACLGRDEWITFWKASDTDRNQVKRDSTKLIAHLGRAFQNRLEPRSQYADPAIYHTLEHGASKIVPAYSTIYWLTSELFADGRLTPDEHTAHSCPASNCGVCLAIGTNGAVAFSEIFGDFRTYLLSEYKALALKDAPVNTTWTSPLILLDASGHHVLEPDSHTINSFHEMFLFSDWLLHPDQESLREELNLELLDSISNTVDEYLDKVATAWALNQSVSEEDQNDEDHNEEDQNDEDHNKEDHHNVTEILNDLRSRISKPTAINQETWEIIKKFLHRITIMSAVEQMQSDGTGTSERLKDYCKQTDPRSALDDFVEASIPNWYLNDYQNNAERFLRGPDLLAYLRLPEANYDLDGIPSLLGHLLHPPFVSRISEQLTDLSLTYREVIADHIRLRIVYHLCADGTPPKAYSADATYDQIADLLAKQLEGMALSNEKDITLRTRLLRKDKREITPLDIIISMTCEDFLNRLAERSTLKHAEKGLTNAFGRIIKAVLAHRSAPVSSSEATLEASLARIDYIMCLWAKSCRLGGYQLFERCEEPVGSKLDAINQ
jgi:hypothetical protein